MSKGERMRNHTERFKSEGFSVRNSSAERENENSTHCVLNLGRFGKFITHRVMNFSRGLETPLKTGVTQFGTRCVPNREEHLTTIVYADEWIAEFDQAELEFAAAIQQGMQKLEGTLK